MLRILNLKNTIQNVSSAPRASWPNLTWIADDVIGPEREGVEEKGEEREADDDTSRAALGAERVLAQRVVHDDVALPREAHDAPRRHETAHLAHVTSYRR